jgi:hypothetical protein
MRTMRRDTDFDFEKTTKTIRFNDDERERLREVMRRVRERNRSAAQLADPSKLIKELMGLADFGLVTEEDRRYITGKGKLQKVAVDKRKSNESDKKISRSGTR